MTKGQMIKLWEAHGFDRKDWDSPSPMDVEVHPEWYPGGRICGDDNCPICKDIGEWLRQNQ